MLLHVDGTKFKVKPTGLEIGGIKARFAKSASIKDLTAKQIAAALTAGKTIEPGVCPFSESSRKAGKKGTAKEDFARQTLFMNDIDNKNPDAPIETPAHVAEVLAAHNLKPAFMYETFNSTADNPRFRFALVSSEEFTDKTERDRVQAAIIAAFPQSDIDCVNADRIFFGTDKGLIEEYTDFEAVCDKADLLALAGAFKLPEKHEQAAKNEWTKYGETIPTGQRHGTLVSFASSVLKKYGVTEQAREAYMKRAAQCEEPKPDDEIEKIWRDACNYYQNTIAADPDYLTPDEYATQDFSESLEPLDYTDLGQAEVFAAAYGDRVKYTPATKWLVYDGKVWEESELKARYLAQELTDRQLEEARKRVKKAQAAYNKAVESEDGDKIKDAKKNLQREENFRGYVLGRRKSNKIAAMLTEAAPKLEIDVMRLDKDPYLLNTPAGTVDLKTGKMRPHDPNDYCTKITACSPSNDGADLFADFLDGLTDGDRDFERYLQDEAGVCAIGQVMLEKMGIANGPGGNGKSTMFNAQRYVLGDYAGGISAEVLTAQCRKNKSPELADMRGKRLIIAAELEEGMRLDTATVKQLCSTDPIQAEKKYKDPFNFIPSHTVILYTNHLPKVGTLDDGTWDRLIVMPFTHRFRGMKGEILNYGNYLFEHAGGAILQWMIDGAKRVIANNFHIAEPQCVTAAIAAYRENNNWLEAFLKECCEIERSYTQKSGELYRRYTDYCDETRDYRRSLADFKAALTEAGYFTRKTMNGAIVYGLRVKDEAARDFESYDGPTPWDGGK